MINLKEKLQEMGITDQHCRDCQLPLQEEAMHLVNAGKDIFDRNQKMTAPTFDCWQKMQNAALDDKVTLQLVSAYRSIDYQCNLIATKLHSGRSIDDILQFNAIPGYSEHHTGRALDLGTPECEHLEEVFEKTEAFRWLKNNAARFDFHMSYPRDNASSIAYEPWHWACCLSLS